MNTQIRETFKLSNEAMWSLRSDEYFGIDPVTKDPLYEMMENEVISEDREKNSSTHTWVIIRYSDHKFFKCEVIYGYDGLDDPEDVEWTEVFEHRITTSTYY